MKTRRGLCYPRVVNNNSHNNMCSEKQFRSTTSCTRTTKAKAVVAKRRRGDGGIVGERTSGGKKIKLFLSCPAEEEQVLNGDYYCDFFYALPDDLVVSILCKLSSTATCPSDFINVLLTYVSPSSFFLSVSHINFFKKTKY